MGNERAPPVAAPNCAEEPEALMAAEGIDLRAWSGTWHDSARRRAAGVRERRMTFNQKRAGNPE